jgi:hypothetical protein
MGLKEAPTMDFQGETSTARPKVVVGDGATLKQSQSAAARALQECHSNGAISFTATGDTCLNIRSLWENSETIQSTEYEESKGRKRMQ